MLVIISEKLSLTVTVGRLVTHAIFNCWIAGGLSKPKERLGFPREKIRVEHNPVLQL